jgi:starch synthase
MDLMDDTQLRQNFGQAGRKRVVELFDYRVVARKFVQIVTDRLGIS